MQTYKYRAIAQDGTSVNGVIEAYDEFEAVNEIRKTYSVVEYIKPVSKGRRVNVDINEPLWVSNKTLAITANQFYIMLRAGLTMTRTIELIAEQCDDKLMKRYLRACASDVAAGYSLADSLDKHGKKIPAVFIETVRAGEESGTLEQSFHSLEVYYTRANKTRKKVKSALTYPIIVLVLAVIVIAIVMVVLVPRMTETLTSMGVDLPWITRALIAISNFMANWWYVILIVIAAVALGLYLFGKSEKGKMAYSRLRLKLPVLGKIARYNAAAQVANTLSTLLAAGLPMTRAIDIVSRVVDLRCVGKELNECIVNIEGGMSLGESLKSSKYLPAMLIEMITVGEASGTLEETLRTIGEFYNDEAVTASDAALGLMEPMITIILGVVVGFIVIAIYVPMFSMSAGIGGGI